MSVTKKIPVETVDSVKLRKWCKENGTSLSALAKEMGYSSKALANIAHSNNTHVTASLYNLLCYTCNVPSDYFLLPEKAKEEPKVTKLEANASELAEIKKTLSEILKALQNIEKELI